MAAEEHIAVVVNRLDCHARLAQQIGAVTASRAPERVVDHLDAGFCDGLQVHQLRQPFQEGGLYVGGLKAPLGRICRWNRRSALLQPGNRTLQSAW